MGSSLFDRSHHASGKSPVTITQSKSYCVPQEFKNIIEASHCSGKSDPLWVSIRRFGRALRQPVTVRMPVEGYCDVVHASSIAA